MSVTQQQFYESFQNEVLKQMNSGEEVPKVLPRSDWVHTNGNEYRVLHLVNTCSENEKYPAIGTGR